MAKFYVTTSIAYVNADPHIGYAAELVQADVLARWHRLRGDDTFFLTGTDENSQKLIKVAEQEKVEPRKIADRYAKRFVELTKTLNLSNDEFIRTTDEKRHFPAATKVWKALAAKGLIYKGTYQGLYCVECEQYYGEDELIDGKCPVHGTPLEKVDEENYFFKLSKFRDDLKKLIESGDYEVTPETRRNEVLSFLDGELKDISFSRPAHKLEMGVPVPGDDSQRMYVWCDALTNYISGVGYGWDEAKYKKWWPADLHVIGKDIWKFHAVYWPAMLLGAGLPFPKQLYVHGFFTIEGKKMSKSKGIVVDPFEAVKTHGVDAVRYYLLRSLPHAEDGDYSESRFKEVYEAELANDLGNLASRVLTLVAKKADGKVPAGTADQRQEKMTRIAHGAMKSLFENCNFADALVHLNAVVSSANQFIDSEKPYNQDGQGLANSLYTLVQTLGHLSLLYHPFIPESAEKLQKQLGLKPVGWTSQTLPEWEKVTPGTPVKTGEPLFPKS